MKKLAVFLSSGEPNFEIKADLEQLAHFLAEQKICMLYGGGKLGLMGYLSRKIKEYDGFVEGITVDMFHKKKYTPDYIDSFKVETNFYDRKRTLNDNADAFLILPGGIGTADEFFDVLNLASLGLLTQTIVVYNKNECWTDLLKWIDKAKNLEMLRTIPKNLVIAQSIDELILSLKSYV